MTIGRHFWHRSVAFPEGKAGEFHSVWFSSCMHLHRRKKRGEKGGGGGGGWGAGPPII